MTPAEHYAEAEKHLSWAELQTLDTPDERWHLAAAQVHATLALATPPAVTETRAQDSAEEEGL